MYEGAMNPIQGNKRF